MKQCSLKKRCLGILLIVLLGSGSMPAQAAALPIAEIIRQGIKRVIIATDLSVQRLQNETILLQHVQKTLENKLSSEKLSEISSWGEKQRNLFDQYYAGFRTVKEVISGIQEVKEILDIQQQMLRSYRTAWSVLLNSGQLHPGEIEQLSRVYAGMLAASVKDTENLILLLKNDLSHFDDASRLEMVHRIGESIRTQHLDLARFNTANLMLIRQREAAKLDWKLQKYIGS